MSGNSQNEFLAGLAMLVGTVCIVFALSVSCLAAQAALWQTESDTLISVLVKVAGGVVLLVLSIPGMIYVLIASDMRGLNHPPMLVNEDPAVLMGYAYPLWIITFLCIIIPFIPRIISGLTDLWLILSPTNWINQWHSKWSKDEDIREKKEAAYEESVADLERAKAELSSLRKRRKNNPDS